MSAPPEGSPLGTPARQLRLGTEKVPLTRPPD
ncbi:hypothetical protein C8J47_2240 [Sphingomonas sp. PP-F2F-G114-C0414]|nr:hypothetical protein C8J47_2240 [Sphingomonas sp. PP-F2F-G114-C0414]